VRAVLHLIAARPVGGAGFFGALVRLFQFQPEDVDAVTATKPIDFFPTSA